MIKIDEFYLKQCVRLRKRWENSYTILLAKQKSLENSIKDLENFETEFAKKYLIIPNNQEEINQFAMDIMSDLMIKAESIDNTLEPYRQEVAKIMDESDKLYDIIAQKYPSLTYEQIKEQIIEYLHIAIK